MKQQLQTIIEKIINQFVNQGLLSEKPKTPIKVDRCKNPEHGDFSSNIAMILAKPMGKPPREVATQIVECIQQSSEISKIESVDIAGPGFINFKMSQTALFDILPTILEQQQQYGCSEVGRGEKVHLEFVSCNPTGPLHVGHGRGAVFGSCVANLLKATGHEVHKEYYVNDAGRQMHILATSIWIRYLNLFDANISFPSNGYKGDYIIDIAESIKNDHADQFVHPKDNILSDIPDDAKYDDAGELLSGDKEQHIDALIAKAQSLLGAKQYNTIFKTGIDSILSDIKNDLEEFGVVFDEWFSEKRLMDNGAIQHCIDVLKEQGILYEQEGALWFRTTDYGDDKDRVVIRANGQSTYFASDIAYHLNKLERGYNTVTDVLGADHHGYVARLKAAMAAMAGRSDALRVSIIQFVSLFRGKQKVSMSTRSGSFDTLRELRNEVGNDATRYFYVMRKIEQPLDFDMELAKSRSNDNPVYYIQYAHARICSVWRQLEQSDRQWDRQQGLQNTALLTSEYEQALATKLAQYPEIINKAALQYEPHLLTHYLYECANQLHTYYNASKYLVEDDKLRDARLCLIKAVQQVLGNGLELLGISAPQQM
ncbi:MAG: arginine--tRNA ligase [Gammaproteobacteria bacterium]|nr:arginine--tRNA ligase [Gammaproteobacteria bacterium]